ncbi:MAG: FtsX-like permease family protein, partial [Gemmatimonadetes bacterium]|nr:FtsX-like permease family protein [Gemmatimonadota bacterium]
LPEQVPDVWTALRLDPAARPVNAHWLSVVGRLATGRTAEDAERELGEITATFTERFPSAYSQRFMRESGFATRAVPLKAHVLGDTHRTLWTLFGSVLLLLAITVANVGNLYLVRAEGRRRELAIRAALGANARRLAGLHVTESVLLALAAAGPALGLTWAGVHVLVRLAPAELPRLGEVHLDAVSIAFTVALTIVGGVLLGVLPVAFRMTDPHDLAEGTRRVLSPVRHRLRQGLVGAQVALALVLLAGAGLMLQSFIHLRAVDTGFEPDGVAVFTVPLPAGRYPDYADVAAFQRELLSGLESLPGVSVAGATELLPLVETNDASHCAALFFDDQPPNADEQPPCLPVLQVAPGYFETLGIPVRGSAPSWSDLDGEAGRVVVTEAFAARVWPGQDPIGRGVRGNGWEEPFYRVAGVAGNVRADGLDRPPLEAVYFPLMPIEGAPLWVPPRTMRIVVRTEGGDAAPLFPSFRDVVTALDPEVPVVEPRALTAAIARSPVMARASFTLVLLGVAGMMALLLSAVGIYGVLAYLVAQRQAEMGVRLALGALPGQVVRLIVGQSLRLAGIGVAVGLVGAVAFTRSLDALLFGVSPTDPWTLGGAAALLLTVALLATLMPALRAARVDPKAVLQAE